MAEKREIGSSGIMVAPLALGGNVFGWTADETTSFRLMDAFVDAGGDMIDTADVYSAWVEGHSGGESETVIGKWLAQSGKRDEVVIATKVGMMAGLAADTVAAACQASLERLGVETIDLYYLHKDDDATPLEETMGAYDALVKAGKIRAVGLSNFTAPRIAEAMRVCEENGLANPQALQPWYNLVERARFEDELEGAAKEAGLSVFPYYGIANGFLAGKYRSKDDLDKSPRGMRNIGYLVGKGPKVLEAMDEVAAETGAPLASIALAWLMQRVTAPIASATSLAQLSELTVAMELSLTDAQIQKLDQASG
ncbi:aldo/keto reductase [Sphingomicrobium clamense]|uniref:Aldo/keto reductase n=1 Tax=Sphingomicrobium clamense TaxID=2851013 RepID=A0ABS6V7R8_9SPHN|nr:aldo/keto reductase [Sphingomicrobium sp. B8]MBW0145622.1 aldo/keto reductase [Sphingomicrobium sp. B8]